MTAYARFVPVMRHSVTWFRMDSLGIPTIFAAVVCRIGATDLGWRQEARLAGTGELGDMLSHRIDFSHLLLGSTFVPISSSL